MNLQPTKRSAVHAVQSHHHHARFLQRHGWEIAASYGDTGAEKQAMLNAATLMDVSWLGKLECKGDWVGTLEGGLVQGTAFYKLIPSHAIWIVPPGSVADAREALESRLAGQKRSYLLDTSSLYGSFELLGPRAADALCKLSSAQVPAGGHKQAPVAGVHCLVIRLERGFQLHFGREYGEYMWESLLDAGDEFGIRPAGLEAIDG